MELNEQEKERIVAEEKLRMETRKEFFKENFGRGGWGMRFRGGWHGGCYGGGCCHRGGILKCLLIVAVIFAACHFWHGPYCAGQGYYGCQAPAAQTAPPIKN